MRDRESYPGRCEIHGCAERCDDPDSQHDAKNAAPPNLPMHLQTGEANQCGRHQAPSRGAWTYWTKKDFPSNSSHHIGEVNERNRVENMRLIYLIGLAPKSRPIKVSPGTKLHIDQDGQNDSSQPVKQNLLFCH